MKKVLSLFLTLVMMLSMISTASAATIAENTEWLNKPLNVGTMPVSVVARVGEAGFEEGEAELKIETEAGASVDYAAKLDMQLIRDMFNEDFFVVVFPDADAELIEEFNEGKISSTIQVVVEYPKTAVFTKDIKTAGALVENSLFVEASREIKNNKLIINYKNKEGLTAGELKANQELLEDVGFMLEDTVTYKEAGNHIVNIAFTGTTTVEFATKKQQVTYNGAASHVVNAELMNIIDHKLVVEPAVPATCYKTGLTEGIKCITCNSYTCGAQGTKAPEVTPKLTHLFKDVAEVPATCTKTGIAAHKTCAYCKKDFASDETNVNAGIEETLGSVILPMIAHTSVPDGVAVAATCTEAGRTQGEKCGVCGKILKTAEIIPTIAHTPHVIAAVAATCTTAGKTAGEDCEVCGKILKAQEIVAATGHSFGEWVTVTPATEDKEGSQKRVCACGAEETAVIPKADHVHSTTGATERVKTPATCVEEGVKEIVCRCGEVLSTEEIPVAAHSLTKVDAKAATCVSNGTIEHYTCSECHKNFRDANAKNELKSIDTPKDKTNHKEGSTVILEGTPATCIKLGLTEGKICTACNTIVEKQKVIQKTKHTAESLPTDDSCIWVGEVAADCITAGIAAHYHCSICNEDFDAQAKKLNANKLAIPALGHNYGEAVQKPGAIPDEHNYIASEKTCGVCGDVVEIKAPLDLSQCPHKIEITDHVTNEIVTTSTLVETVITPSTCEEKGKAVMKCWICAATEGAEYDLPLAEHKLGATELVAEVLSTCKVQGTEAHYVCAVCEKIFDLTKQEIEAPKKLELLPHDFVEHGNHQECRNCGEKFKLKKKDKDGKEDATVAIELNKASHVKQEQDDIEVEEVLKEAKAKIETEFEVTAVDETSNKIEEKILADKPSEETEVNKMVVEIDLNKNVYYEASTQPVVIPYNETEELVEFTIDISAIPNIEGAKSVVVYREHEGESERITANKNADGEYAEVDYTGKKVKLHVKKFSEYAVVAYSEEVNIKDDNDAYVSTGSPSSTTSKLTVKFETNGAEKIDSIIVKKGETVTLPAAPTKEGYKFDGWYTDAKLTQSFDEKTAILKNLTLYAKWVEETEEPVFTDVPETEWYYESVMAAYEKGLMKGVSETEFAPNDEVTRAMFVTVLHRMSGNTIDTKDIPFSDVAADSYYAAAVSWAKRSEIVKGVTENEFAPDQKVTREQMAAMLYRYAESIGIDVIADDELVYTDADSVSEYAVPAIKWAAKAGVMKGNSDGTFAPLNSATRAELATVFVRIIDTLK